MNPINFDVISNKEAARLISEIPAPRGYNNGARTSKYAPMFAVINSGKPVLINNLGKKHIAYMRKRAFIDHNMGLNVRALADGRYVVKKAA